jgi:hypothetical protein
LGNWRSIAPKDLLHLGQLLPVRLEIRGAPGFRRQRLHELAFLGALLEQDRALLLPDQEVVAARGHDHEQQRDGRDPDRDRPAARIVRVEVAQLVQHGLQLVHLAATFFAGFPAGLSRLRPRPWPGAAGSRTA